MFKKHGWLLLVLVVGILLRIVRLDYLELFGDEVDAGYQAYSLATYGTDYRGHRLPTYAQSFSEWRAPGLMYAMIPAVKIFGLNEWGVRLTPVFFGVFSLVLFYWLLMASGVNRNISVLAVGMVAISPWHIQYSRSAFELTLLASMLLLGSIVLLESVRKRSVWGSVLAAVIYSLGFYTYNTANVYVPLMSLLVFWFLGKNIFNRQMLIFILTGLVMAGPIIYQVFWGHAADRFKNFSVFGSKEVAEEVIKYRNASGNITVTKMFFNKYIVGGKKVLFNYTNAFSSLFLAKEGDVTFRHSLHQVGNIFWVVYVLAILGLIFNRNRFWLGFLLLSPIPASLTIDGYNHASRLFMMVFPLSYLAAVGFGRLGTVIRWVALAVLMFEFLFFQNYYWNFYQKESWRWWHFGYRELMADVDEISNNYSRIYIENTYEPALIRYLFWQKIDPKLVYSISDKMEPGIDGYNGFCLDRKTCFVNYRPAFDAHSVRDRALYVVSQNKNVAGDWDWEKSPPDLVRVRKTVRSPDGNPLFYLVEKK